MIARRAMLVAFGMLAGCDKYFLDPYIDQLDNPTREDLHVLINAQWRGENESCLPAARQKRDYFHEHGFDAEIVVILLHGDTRTHAVVVSSGEVFDNGALHGIPFDRKDLGYYGREVPWDPRWGEK